MLIEMAPDQERELQCQEAPQFPRGPPPTAQYATVPNSLRTISDEDLIAPYHATVLSSAGLALALTHNHAHVWDYSSSNGPTKVISLPLQFGLKNTDPLPLGAIVRNGPANDYGVIALAPSTGKISFWENIDSADTRSLYPQRSQGVESFVKLYSGENITELVDVEHAGYVLVFSSGRLAQLTLRDSQGRPSINTTVLSAPSGSNGSFFSFKGLLGGSARKTIASVQSRSSQSKGHMEVISATRSGTFQIWDLSWSGQHNHIRDIDAHESILTAVQADLTPEIRSQQDVQLLDFAIMKQREGLKSATVLALVARTGRETLDYFLLQLELWEDVMVTRAIPVRNFQQPHLTKDPVAKLLLPHHGHTAYIQFPRAIFVASLVQSEDDGPEAQLRADAGLLNLPYQDTIYFRDDLNVEFSGSALEEPARKDDCATALFFVHGYGLLQITAQPPPTDEKDRERIKVTARSKLEQSTFFSTIPGNVIDFSVKSRYSFEEDETAEAALHISAKILKSSYEYLEKVTSSMDDQFRKRAFALKTLITQLQAEYPELPYPTKWKLLWHAEKLAACHKLWNWYEDKLQDQKAHPETYPEKIMMDEIVKAVHERYKTALDPEAGETDRVRNFLLKDVDNIYILLPWGWHSLRAFYMKDDRREKPSVLQRLSEATDLMLVVLETAFEFRKASMELYGLDPGSLQDGILKPNHGYDRLSHHFWTSSHNIVSSIRSLVDVGRNLAIESYEEGHWIALAAKIGKDNPRMVHLGCQTHLERFQWGLAQSDEKPREMGRELRNEWNTNVRPKHILGLGEIGLATEGMELAEQYRDMPTLVDLIWEESNWLESEKASTRSKMEQAESTVKLNRIKERISRYFESYGDDWAGAFYSKYIKEGQAAQLFLKEYHDQPALTRFLRADPSRARMSWINDVTGEKDYETAATTLFEASTKQETNAWCQRVELSMAKLAMLCGEEKKSSSIGQSAASQRPENPKFEKARMQQSKAIESQLEYTKIQEELYERLLPVITGALDDDTAIELLMAEFGQGHLAARPALQSILKEGFSNLIHNRVIDPVLMIDILTLMQPSENEELISNVQNNEFYYALKVLILNWSSIHRTTRESVLKLIWKRLIIRDDWTAINNTKDVSDAQLNDILLQTATGWTFRSLSSLIGRLFLHILFKDKANETQQSKTIPPKTPGQKKLKNSLAPAARTASLQSASRSKTSATRLSETTS